MCPWHEHNKSMHAGEDGGFCYSVPILKKNRKKHWCTWVEFKKIMKLSWKFNVFIMTVQDNIWPSSRSAVNSNKIWTYTRDRHRCKRRCVSLSTCDPIAQDRATKQQRLPLTSSYCRARHAPGGGTSILYRAFNWTNTKLKQDESSFFSNCFFKEWQNYEERLSDF